MFGKITDNSIKNDKAANAAPTYNYNY